MGSALEGLTHYPRIKTSPVGYEDVVSQINGHIERGNKIYVPTNGRFSDVWDGYPFGLFDFVDEAPETFLADNRWSTVLHVLAPDVAATLKTIAIPTSDLPRIIGIFRNLGLHVYRRCHGTVETERVATAVEPYGVSDLVSRVVASPKGMRIMFVGDRDPLLLKRPSDSTVAHTLIRRLD